MAPIIRGNSLYTIVGGATWGTGEANAIDLGGHLAAITTQDENTYLAQAFSFDTTAKWLGLREVTGEGDWQWSNGESKTYTNWFYDPNIAWSGNAQEPNNWRGVDEQYCLMYFHRNSGGADPLGYWADGVSDSTSVGIAEIPLSLSITRSGTPKEAADSFTTSINLSAGTQTSGNLAEGAQVWWKIDGITQDDLASGALTGTGTITNGKLDIQHSLVSDADTGEQFSVSVYSDSAMTQQIGATSSAGVQEAAVSSGVTRIEFSQDPVSISGQATYVTMHIDFAPRTSGYSVAGVHFYSPNDYARKYLSSIPVINNTATAQIPLDQWSANGDWRVAEVNSFDTNSNFYVEYEDALASKGLDTRLSISNPNGDNTLPTLSTLTSQQEVGLPGAIGALTFKAGFVDNLSGVDLNTVTLRAYSPSGEGRLLPGTIDQATGVLTFSWTDPQEEGTYSIGIVVASDNAGNQITLFQQDLSTLGFATTCIAIRTNANQPPTDITLTSTGITENSTGGTVVGTLAATDPDAGSTFTYALTAGNGTNDADNALVEIVGSEVRVKSGAVIDYETNPVLNINVQVTDNGGLSTTKAVTASVLNSNEAPTNLTLSSSGISENSTGGSLIGTLSATDSDANSTFTYALAAGNGTTDADNNLVTISGNQVLVKSGAVIDFETNPILNLNIQVTDNGNPGLTYTKAVTANVIDVVNEDITPPTITDISVQGNNVILTFSEKVQTTGIDNSTFVVKVGGTARSVSGNSLDPTNQNKVTLTLSGTAPASSTSLQVSYSGTNSNVVKDIAGNSLGTFTNRSADTFLSGASVTSLYADYTNLTLRGSTAINGTGNAKNNTITGNQANNSINGAVGADVLTGQGGTDTFVYTTLANSLLGTPTNYTFDRITDFAVGQDRIDGPKTASTSQVQELGTVTTLDQAGLQGVLTSTKFVANGAASFTYNDNGSTRTFVALNNNVAGFDVTKDAVVEITGYSGLLTNLAIV